MSSQSRSSSQNSSQTAAPAQGASTAPTYEQPLGNEAAQQRAGLGGSGSLLEGDLSVVTSWLWEGVAETFGFETDEKGDHLELAFQTTKNFVAALERVGEAAELADAAGHSQLAESLRATVGKFGGTDGLATDLVQVIEVREKLQLVEKLLDTTMAVVEVDMRDPAAAATFDAWFATVGEVGEEVCDLGGMWGAVLKPFATFVKMFGEYNLFATVKQNMMMHGTRFEDSPNLRAWRDAEG